MFLPCCGIFKHARLSRFRIFRASVMLHVLHCTSTTTVDLSVMFLDSLHFFQLFVFQLMLRRSRLSNVGSLVFNITVTCSFPSSSGSSAPSPPLPHVSDDSFSSLTQFPPISSVFVSSLPTLHSTTLRNPLRNARNLSEY